MYLKYIKSNWISHKHINEIDYYNRFVFFYLVKPDPTVYTSRQILCETTTNACISISSKVYQTYVCSNNQIIIETQFTVYCE